MAMKPIEILIEAKATGGAEIDALSKRLDDLSSQQALIERIAKRFSTGYQRRPLDCAHRPRDEIG